MAVPINLNGMSSGRADIAVIGGGILGLAHAYVLARAGKRVVMFERSSRAIGASVRNFGMIWPIGQPAREIHDIALRSRRIWLEALEASRLSYRPVGSLHVAYQADEADVLREFAEIGPTAGYECRWLEKSEAIERSQAIRSDGLAGALWSGTELTVDPREFVGQFGGYLREVGVQCRYGECVRSVQLPWIETARGRWEVERAIICAGDDFETLYPLVFAESGITKCKLQMMRTEPQPDGWELGPALATGLTLRFYKAFRICSTLEKLKARVAAEKPEYERWAIHVLASQTSDGAITLGDSHEYGLTPEVFDRVDIDELILAEARTFLRLPSWQIAERWHGSYALHPELPFLEAEPEPGVTIVTAPGGSGMTLSFGLAERMARRIAECD